MFTSEKQITRFGAMAFITAGILFLVGNLLIATRPAPPNLEAEFVNWLSENKLFIAIHNETLMFSAVSLIPSAYVLYKLLKNRSSRSSLLGLGLLVVAIPVLVVLVFVEGQLVYPVYGIRHSVDVLKLVLGMYHAGMHAISLLFAGAIIFISYALRETIFPQFHWYLGLMTGVAQIVGSFPWLIGLAVNIIVILLLSAWLVTTGVIILQKVGQAELAAAQPTGAG